jgi:hypothetical protein
LLGDRTHGFHTDVDGDAFTSGYVPPANHNRQMLDFQAEHP